MIYTVYDQINGQILYTINSDDPINLDQSYIIGNYNGLEHYVDLATKTIVDKPAQPSTNHIWAWDTRSWQLDSTLASAAIRSQRNGLLSAVDRVNPVWYLALSAEQQTELSAYRQALLAVPQQSGFPESVTWPDKPTWL
jgi:hypothetical protein